MHKLKILLLYSIIFFSGSVYSQNTRDVQLANEYYGQGEYEKARVIYEKLARNPKNIPLIHSNYLYLLMETKDYEAAEDYLGELLKDTPENIYYHLDRAYLEVQRSNLTAAQHRFDDIVDQVKSRPHLVRIVTNYLLNKQLTDEALKTFIAARKAMDSPYEYALEMANVYRLMNNQDGMVKEYLNYVIQNPSNIKYVQNTLQNLLTDPKDLESLEYLLYDKIQKDPDNDIYGELLIWVHLQQHNFYGAFVQSRAIDKRIGTQGSKSLDIGMIALENDDYENSIKIFSYIIREYPDSYNYILARMYLIKAYEKQVRNTFPINKEAIVNLTIDYNKFIKDMGGNRNALEAMRNKALLHAFYLNQKDSAIEILEYIVKQPQAGGELIAKSKLDLGDIYLLEGKPWESTLLYSQVEKSRKEDAIGYDAKLRNAKLSYYNGDFNLAMEHLDILKQATTRQIANDAMQLSVLIKDNTAFDSTNAAMKDYAETELLLFQHRDKEAIAMLDSMKRMYTHHPITDEILWLEANLKRKNGSFENAAQLLQNIVNDFPRDIWADDAYFLLAEIYEHDLNNTEKAMELYRDFLTRYPGSIHVTDARKRFRALRGDNPENKFIDNEM